MINYKSLCDEHTKPIRVAAYARVSSEHEAQISALQNQVQYYDKKLEERPNFILTEMFVDEGISGTQAKKRPAFLRMIESAKRGELDLIMTREVSRMARNTKESLEYVEILQNHGVEVWFTEDGIWSMRSEDSFKLGIMSLLAEQESRKISSRVLAGQMISRENKVLYGSGNILGYDLVIRKSKNSKRSVPNTYVINEEQAETVRMIYHMYLHEGLGMKRICSKLIEEGRKDATGKVRWDASKIARILDNRTYAGYIGFKKSVTMNPISHKRIKNPNIMEYEYVKGDFPAIIDDDDWQAVQRIRKSRAKYSENLQHNIGTRQAADIWRPKLVCQCGKHFLRYKWHRNQKSGEVTYGYQCYNVVRNRKREFLEEQGADLEGKCNMSSIPEWKFNFMFQRIMEKIWKSPARTVNKLVKLYSENYTENTEVYQAPSEEESLTSKLEKLETRKKNLTEMRLDGTMDAKEYGEYLEPLLREMEDIKNKLSEMPPTESEKQAAGVPSSSKVEEVKETLVSISKYDEKIDNEFATNMVERVVPHEDASFDWYLDLSLSDKEFDAKNYILYQSFKISFEEAKAYRKSGGNFVRLNQWKDITVNIYLNM